MNALFRYIRKGNVRRSVSEKENANEKESVNGNENGRENVKESGKEKENASVLNANGK